MICAEAEELILESFDAPLDANSESALDGHLVHCMACRELQRTQRELDQSLAGFHTAPALSPEFDAGLRRMVAVERRRAVLEYLPDLLHVGGGVATSLLCAWLLPFSRDAVLAIGAASTLSTYLLLAFLRSLFDDV